MLYLFLTVFQDKQSIEKPSMFSKKWNIHDINERKKNIYIYICMCECINLLINLH